MVLGGLAARFGIASARGVVPFSATKFALTSKEAAIALVKRQTNQDS
jgi:hypothetical protein